MTGGLCVQHTVVKIALFLCKLHTVGCTVQITVKCSASHLAFVGEREGGWEREKGVTRIQFITSEAAGTQPTMHTERDVQNAQQFAQRTICKMHNLHNGHSEWQGHMCHCTATFVQCTQLVHTVQIVRCIL